MVSSWDARGKGQMRGEGAAIIMVVHMRATISRLVSHRTATSIPTLLPQHHSYEDVGKSGSLVIFLSVRSPR